MTRSSAKCTGNERIEIPPAVSNTFNANIVETKAPPKLPILEPIRCLKGLKQLKAVCKGLEVLDQTGAPAFEKPMTTDTVPEAAAGACTVCAT